MALHILNRAVARPGNLRGVLLVLVAALASSAMNGAIRHVSADLHPFEVAFFRNLFGFAVLMPAFLRLGLTPLRTQKLRLHALRGGFNVFAMLAFFLAISMTQLATVAALSFTSPLFASLGAFLILKETMGVRRWLGLAVGFLGAVIILRPGLEALSPGAVLVVVSSASWALALLVIKVLGRTESSLTTTLYAGLFLTPTSLLASLPYWQWPSLGNLSWMVLIGGLGSIGQICVAQAFREADATAVLPMDFTKLLWSSLIGFLAFAEVPDLWTLVGGTIIFSSVTYIAYRESRLPPGRPVKPTRFTG